MHIQTAKYAAGAPESLPVVPIFNLAIDHNNIMLNSRL